ncbi:50S ribosomal protein L18 [Flexithrix dorotheae]|uniref:50S ribosomal protein L18 n=1 Tax=Flexithrix dorotheae TaxID=70993 RepID=UPI00036F099A|nr:50S ribosomal protein L18 [Flexithrix dorotheae]
MATKKDSRRLSIKRRIRNKISGTAAKPRLSVFKSNTSITVQVIDDLESKTLVFATSKEVSDKKNVDLGIAKEVGKKIAEKAKSSGIETVVFDRNGYLYHGKVKALAEGAREGGLKF